MITPQMLEALRDVLRVNPDMLPGYGVPLRALLVALEAGAPKYSGVPVIVICQNDYPIAVVATPELAERIKDAKHRPDPEEPGQRAVYIHCHQFSVQTT